jgi:hypothetical protein
MKKMTHAARAGLANAIRGRGEADADYAEPGQARIQALRMVWPIVCRRLEELPNINAMEVFDELCVQFLGRFTRKQYKSLVRRVSRWRQDARARGVITGTKTYRRLSDKPRGRRPDISYGRRRV